MPLHLALQIWLNAEYKKIAKEEYRQFSVIFIVVSFIDLFARCKKKRSLNRKLPRTNNFFHIQTITFGKNQINSINTKSVQEKNFLLRHT